jgi:hypothetical protein
MYILPIEEIISLSMCNAQNIYWINVVCCKFVNKDRIYFVGSFSFSVTCMFVVVIKHNIEWIKQNF